MSIRFDREARATVSLFGAPEDDESLVGRVLDDRFEIRELVGTGSHGAVYEAWDRRHGIAVALKTLLHLAPEELVRFKGEFRVLTDLSHPNLVTPHELFVGRDAAYLTMELVDGTDFLTWVRGEDLDALYEDRLRDSTVQLASGLAALHAFGLLHRDLKPSNVLVRSDGQVLLADFGLAQPLQGGSAGGLFGTPAYMSPEQAADMELSPASDWYSVGVMLFEAMTGEYPYGGLSGMGLMMAKQTRSPGRPSKVHPGIAEDLDALCERLLERDASKRPGARELLTVLGAVEPLESRSRAEDEEVFVGRVDELGRLGKAWRSVGERQAAVLFIVGPSGTGKSTLVKRFVGAEIETGTVVLRGRCYERESVPYKGLDVLVDSLREHLLSPDAYRLRPLTGGAALARVFPVLADVPGIGDQPTVPIEDPLEQRRQAVAALRELLRRLARARPVLMLLDDLQWCDDDTASVLVELLRAGGRPPLLFVGLYRVEDAQRPVLCALTEALPTVAGLSVETLELAPLDTERATELATKLLPSGAPTNAAKAIASEAEGNPLFVAELVRHASIGGEGRTTSSLEAVVVERASHHPQRRGRFSRSSPPLSARLLRAWSSVRRDKAGEWRLSRCCVRSRSCSPMGQRPTIRSSRCTRGSGRRWRRACPPTFGAGITSGSPTSWNARMRTRRSSRSTSWRPTSPNGRCGISTRLRCARCRRSPSGRRRDFPARRLSWSIRTTIVGWRCGVVSRMRLPTTDAG